MVGGNVINLIFVIILQLGLLALFIIFARYDTDQDLHSYPMFQDVHVMIFIGFGFLMTFLRRYGYSAVGFNFLLASLIVQWAIICQGFYHLTDNKKIQLNVESLLGADVAAATVLISMGAVLGKTSYIQLLVMGIVEIAFFAANLYLGVEIFKVSDPGCSIFVHTFGAYFGMAVSFIHCRKYQNFVEENALEGPSYTSDLFAMIGTVFLWIFWPSFNAADLKGDDQLRGVINTYLSLASCCVCAFVCSALVNPDRKFDMVHIQNSTLAGGVAVGTAANLMLQPFGAIIVGILAGVLSVLGYKYITPCLCNKLKLHDTCGVHNLHGMPGVLAALIGALMAGIATEKEYGKSLYDIYPARAPSNYTSMDMEYVHLSAAGVGRSASGQAGYQLLAVLVTLGVAIVSGLLTGLLILIPCKEESVAPYDDATFWSLPDEVKSAKE